MIVMKVVRYSKKNESAIIHTTVKILKRGGLIVYPTDTIYGIGCDATCRKAVQKIYRIKKRLRSKPLSILVSSLGMARKYVNISRRSQAIRKLPGKYTFILPAKRKLSVSSNNIGIRIPNHWCIKLARKLGKPITTTSANISKRKTPSKIQAIQKTFGSKIDLYIDAGTLNKSPSKVYSLEEKRIR